MVSEEDSPLKALLSPRKPVPPPAPSKKQKADDGIYCLKLFPVLIFQKCCLALPQFLKPEATVLHNGEFMPEFQDDMLLRRSSLVVKSEVIGSGASGQVRAGFVKGRSAAIKIIDLGKHPEPGILIRDIRTEISIMARLQHDNVVKFMGVATRKTRVLIAMERCLGSVQDLIMGTLLPEQNLLFLQSPRGTEKRRRFPQLSRRLRLEIATNIAEGMAYLHSERVLHRDLKPANALIECYDEEAQVCRIKIADFGLSKLKHSELVSNLTLTAAVGTPLYMAPELITSSPNAKYGPQADIYSWSILTYAVWTMKTPFVGPRYDSLTAPGLLDLIKRGERPRFEGLGMPLALRSLLQDAWHPSPRLRPHSFNEVLSRITDLKTEKQSSNLTDQSCILRSSNSTLDDSFFVDDDALLEDLVQDEERRRRVTDGAQQLRRLQEQDLERRLSMDAANNGHLEALVGWIIAIPEVTERAAVIGIKKKGS